MHGWRLVAATDPLVVDLGYGATTVTTRELRERLLAVRRDLRVVGVENDRARVESAQPDRSEGLDFVLGGFELPVGGEPVLVRAMNVLRQYDEAAVPAAWSTMTGRLAPEGLLVEGTCDELGRIGSWVALDRTGPVSLTFACRVGSLERPSDLAERLPKALIHHNVPGEPVHALLAEWDRAWASSSPYSSFGPRQQWVHAIRALRAAGWPVLDGPARWRLGELTVAWSSVAPA